MKYLYTKEKQTLVSARLSSVFNVEAELSLLEDVFIETIRNGHAPILTGENHGMFNKTHSETAKDAIANANRNKVVVKDKDGIVVKTDIDDPRYLSGELIGIASGKVAVKNSSGEKFLVSKDDPRYLSGELIGVQKGVKFKQKTTTNKNKGTFLAKNRDGCMCRLTKDDPRYLSGEYIHFRSKF